MGQVDPHSTGESLETSLQRVDIGPTRREWCSWRQLFRDSAMGVHRGDMRFCPAMLATFHCSVSGSGDCPSCRSR